MKQIKLLIVDDSSFMRIVIRKIVKSDKNIKVIGEAQNGKIALEIVEKYQPDVITMDVEMPVMDGLAATQEIMKRMPKPIIMVSSLTQEGTNTTLKALELGAVDFVSKSSSFVDFDVAVIEKDLINKLHFWAKKPLPNFKKNTKEDNLLPSYEKTVNRIEPLSKVDLVVIGVSTGGPKILANMLKLIGNIPCPVVIAQHMPKMFTASFAGNLKNETSLNVVEGRHGMVLEPGLIAIAKGGTDSVVHRGLSGDLILHEKFHPEAPVHPWIDPLFKSAVRITKSPVAVILTGMGNDGTQGAIGFRDKGLPVLVQEPESCIVDGMPSSAIKEGAVSHILRVEQIGKRIAKWVHI